MAAGWVVQDSCGGTACPADETEDCSSAPVDCVYTWGEYGECSDACNGTRTRSPTVTTAVRAVAVAVVVAVAAWCACARRMVHSVLLCWAGLRGLV